MRRLPRALLEAAARAPRYAPYVDAKRPSLAAVPPADLHALVASQEASGDPFAGRRPDGAEGRCVVQVGDRVPLFLSLTHDDLAGAARALASAWRSFGVGRGDSVLIYDYGTSPLTLFASWCYVPGLRRGAADILGATPVCNDGLPEFASRALHVLRFVRPAVTFVEREVMPALVRAAADEAFPVSRHTRLVAVSADEEIVDADDVKSWADALGVPVRQLLRSGPALLFAPQCEQGAFHVDSRRYLVEVLPDGGEMPSGRGEGRVCVTNLFLRGAPAIRYVTDVVAAIDRRACPCGAPGVVLRPTV